MEKESDSMFRFVILLVFAAIFCSASAAKDDNVVVDSRTEVFRFVADKDADRPTAIKRTTTTIYRALHKAGTAVDMAYYNDYYLSIKKASGGKTHYGSFFPDDIFFSDSKACLTELPLKGAGATAKATVERSYDRPEYFDGIYLIGSYPAKELTVKLIMPRKIADVYTIKVLNVPAAKVTRTEETKGDEVTVTYVFKDMPAVKDEPRSPSLNITGPRLAVKGYFSDANDLYRYLYRHTEGADPDPEAVKKATLEVTAGCTTDSARIAAINNFVHRNVRYIAVEHGELGITPDKPSEVLHKRYGDCKGSAGLLRAMLREAGIDGRYVWIGTDAIADDFTDAPVLGSGDHMIAAALTGDSILFIDGTATYNGVGQYPAGIQGRQVLIENTPDECLVARVPVQSPETNLKKVTVKYLPSDNGEAAATYTESMAGRFNAVANLFVDKMSAERRDNRLCRYIADERKGCRVTNPVIERGDSTSIITADLRVEGAVKKYNDEMYVDLSPFYSLRSELIDMEERTLPVQLDALSRDEFTTIFPVPAGYEVVSLPEATAVDSEWCDIAVAPFSDTAAGTIGLTVTRTIKKRDIPLDRIEEYNACLKKAAKALGTTAVLKKSAAE